MDNDFCPVFEAIQLLQEKWTLHIVRALLDGPVGFNELARRVGGVNPATLASRLDHLVELGLVHKTIHSTMPPRTAYELCDAGVELQSVVEAIDDWGRRNLTGPLSTPVKVSA
ncbi:MAG TPA: helix-turn-helix domain-containing protein [Candidatus Dormibacteraeota bacterium]|jgi:DNA-binding HxlR family transcriptional regulator|nr:helix-turn-helix domain-containing protein [Candidatus Dormibacteraeota bacterium]